jgi:chromosome segregation ATPase
VRKLKKTRELSEKIERENRELSERIEKDNRLSEKIQNIEENIRLENGKLIEKFEREKKFSKELQDGLENETTRLYANIKQVKDNADKEFSGVRDRFDSLVSQVNEQIVQVTDNTKEIAKKLIHEVDQKLSEVACNIVTNKERTDERMNKLEDIKAVQSSLKGDVTKWQSETREQVNKEIKQFESCKARLDKMNAELDNMKVKIAERSAVVGNTGSLPPTDGNLDACQSTCGSAHTLEGEVNQTAPGVTTVRTPLRDEGTVSR